MAVAGKFKPRKLPQFCGKICDKKKLLVFSSQRSRGLVTVASLPVMGNVVSFKPCWSLAR